MHTPLPMDKNQIRIHYLARRERFQPAIAAEAAATINERVLEVISGSATTVAGYSPIRSELDITPAMEACHAKGLRLCLPVIEAPDKPLYFRRWKWGETLERGRYGVQVPPAGAATAKPEVILVPLVAFDRSGHRLGYGAGYYDRTIRHLRGQEKNMQIIGVAYSIQEVDHIPANSLDEKLDVIVTEKEVIRCL